MCVVWMNLDIMTFSPPIHIKSNATNLDMAMPTNILYMDQTKGPVLGKRMLMDVKMATVTYTELIHNVCLSLSLGTSWLNLYTMIKY